MNRGRFRSSRGAGGGGGMLFILAFHALAHYAGREHKPPVTAALILANLLVFFRPGRLDDILPTIGEVCLNPRFILKDWDVKRLFLSAFYHADETHLVYNMLSLLWKGVQLEVSLGSLKFAKMVAILLALSHGLVVVLAKGFDMFADYPDTFYSHCAIGFSAVLFALKVVLNWNSPNQTVVYGVPVPARHAAWAELILVQMFVPGTSFLGHFCGILAGLIYVNYSNWLTTSGIIPRVSRRLSYFRHQLLWPIRSLLWPAFGSRGRRLGENDNDGHGYRRIGSPLIVSAVWRCQMCTFDNPVHATECEMCGAPPPELATSSSPSAPPLPASMSTTTTPSLEEMRRARLSRFSR